MSDDEKKTRLKVGGALIAFAWLLAAATVVGLLLVLPGHQVDDYAGLIVLGGLAVGAIAMAAVFVTVIDDLAKRILS